MNPDEDTEFNDALRKHGIIPPKPAPPTSPSPPASPSLSDELADFTPSALSELAADAPDSDTERFIHSYERQRAAQLKEEERKARFGSVKPIGRDDYTREVTEASQADDDGEGSGTGVVCFLYSDGHAPSIILGRQLETLAARHPRTKFVSIIGNKCIPNYPDKNIPTLLMYRKGEMTQQVVAWGASKERSIEDLEALLVSSTVILPASERLHRPTQSLSDNEDDDNDPDIPPSQRISAAKRNLRSRTSNDDDDSDFDW